MARAGTEPREPPLARLPAELEAIEREAHALAGTLTDRQLNWAPGPGRWSIGQCLDHLTRTVRLYPEAIRRMIDDAAARAAAGRRPYREGWVSRWIVRSMEPPVRQRVRTMAAVAPPPRLERERVLAEFTAAHRELAALARAAGDVDPRQARMRSPFLRVLHFTLGQVLRMNVAHARRHLWQARQVRDEAGFPEA